MSFQYSKAIFMGLKIISLDENLQRTFDWSEFSNNMTSHVTDLHVLQNCYCMGRATITIHTSIPHNMCTNKNEYFLRNCTTAKLSCLNTKEKEAVEKFVKTERQGCCHCDSYNEYIAEERAAIGKYAADNSAIKSCRHFSSTAGELPKVQLAISTDSITLIQRVSHTIISVGVSV